MLCGDVILRYLQPFLMNGFDAAGSRLIGAHPVDAAHKNVANGSAYGCANQKICVDGEAGVDFNTFGINIKEALLKVFNKEITF